MNRKTILYVLAILALFVGLLSIQSSTKAVNWTKSYSKYDKNPYGAYAFSKLVDGLYENNTVVKSDLTIYELLKEDSSTNNIISISESLNLDHESIVSLLEKVNHGGTALLSAHHITYELKDTLKFETKSEMENPASLFRSLDSLRFKIQDIAYAYSSSELITYFDELPEAAIVLDTNQLGNAITASLPYGQGRIILNSTPIIFTNFFMLYKENHQASASLLSLMPDAPTHWTEYYQVGKMYSKSPLSVLLQYDALKYAIYLTVALIFLLVLFEAKRKQSVIPILNPPRNHTLDFIHTVAMLYFKKSNHKAPATNRISYFKEYLMTQYALHWEDTSLFVKTLASKSRQEEDFLNKLISSIKVIERSTDISDDDLLRFNKQLDIFYHKNQK